MGARGGQNNFRRHQRDVVEAGVKKLKIALRAIPRRMRFDDFNALARYVANVVGMHPTTVGRNLRYRKTVWDHVLRNPTIITQDRGQFAITPEPGAVEALRIEVDLLKRDNERLRKLLAAISEQQPLHSATALPAELAAQAGHLRQSFERTATVLARLLNWAAEREIGIIADIERGEILDDAEIGRNRVIAAPPDTTDFFDWLKHHVNQVEGSHRA
jgi:hypothetical protein